MMNIQDVWQQCFHFGGLPPMVVEPVDEPISSDAGLLPLRQLDERLGLTAGFAAQLTDTRHAVSRRHTLLEMVRSRTFGMLAGYEDQNDHDALRSDSIFKLVAGRLPSDDDLASQPTLSRFENAIASGSLLKLEDWFIEQFVSCWSQAPRSLMLDIDVFDDPTHGDQQLTFFHGYYDQYQYLARVITCAENDQVVLPTLLHGTAHPTLGAADDLARVVAALRRRNRDVRIGVRADSGYASPAFYEACERLEIDYTIGLGMNSVLKARSDELLERAVAQYEQTGQPQRLFTAFWYQAQSWHAPRWVVVKCEAHSQGTNRRAVVTNRPGARVLPQAAYDEYTQRGESENRNKELKCGLSADRLSDHRYLANCFRLFMHTLAHNLLVHARRLLPEPTLSQPRDAFPVEALAGRPRRQHFNRRRAADPLGEGHPGTWRTMLIKVAARVVVRARRVRILISASWPFLDFYRQVSEAVLVAANAPAADSS
jgi:Transposase DDE domain group 1